MAKTDLLKKLAGKAPNVVSVETQEWTEDGVKQVYVRDMGVARRDAYNASNWVRDDDEGNGHVDLSNMTAKLCVLGICSESGEFLYTLEDAEWFGNLASKPVHRIADRVRDLSGLREEAVEATRGN